MAILHVYFSLMATSPHFDKKRPDSIRKASITENNGRVSHLQFTFHVLLIHIYCTPEAHIAEPYIGLTMEPLGSTQICERAAPTAPAHHPL